jgi:hypothetical protein
MNALPMKSHGHQQPKHALPGATLPRNGALVPKQARSNASHIEERADRARLMYVQMEARSNIAYTMHAFKVRHDATRRLLDDTFDPASIAFFNLSVIMQADLKSHQLIADGISSQLDKLINDLNEGMLERLAQLARETNETGVDEPHYHGAERVSAQVLVPNVTKYLTMVENYDQILVMTDALWYAAKINDKVRAQTIREWRNALKKFTRKVKLINDHVMRVQRRLRAGEVLPTEAEAQVESVNFMVQMVGSSDRDMQRAVLGKNKVRRKGPKKASAVREVSVAEHMQTRQPSLGESHPAEAASGAVSA